MIQSFIVFINPNEISFGVLVYDQTVLAFLHDMKMPSSKINSLPFNVEIMYIYIDLY